MKKFFKSLVFGAGLILGSQFMAIPTVAAQDVYIQFDSGCDIYIVTESIDTNGIDYVNVTLKYIKNGRLVETEHRNYGRANNGQWWKNSEEGKRDGLRATRVWEPEKEKILVYCLNYR